MYLLGRVGVADVGFVAGFAGPVLAGGVGEGGVAVGFEFDGPLFGVDDRVVFGAEQDQIVEPGWSAAAPVVNVVGLGPGDWSVAAGEAAATIAARYSAKQVVGNGPR